MNEPRILLVTPRFWPHAGLVEQSLGQMAVGLAEQGLAVTVATARWDDEWPTRISYRGVTVERIVVRPAGAWRSLRYPCELTHWLRQNRPRFDLAYAAGAELETLAVRSVGRDRRRPLPWLVQAEADGPGDRWWWDRPARFAGRRHRLAEAAAVVCRFPETAATLANHGIEAERLRVIPPGVVAARPRTAAVRTAARESLAAVNHDLAAADFAPVAVCLSRLEKGAGLTGLMRAWRQVAARWPCARLWLIGDGPLRRELYDWIGDCGLRGQVLLPGTFDDLTELFAAADVMLAAGANLSNLLAVVHGLAGGLPVVAYDSPRLRDLVQPGVHGELVPEGRPVELVAAVAGLFEDLSRTAARGESARRHAATKYDATTAAAQHGELFREVLERCRGVLQ